MVEDLTRLDIAKVRQFFGIIEWQADRMRGLIWDLLEVARIEAGTLSLAPVPIRRPKLGGAYGVLARDPIEVGGHSSHIGDSPPPSRER